MFGMTPHAILANKNPEWHDKLMGESIAKMKKLMGR
jgi:hypothetical protein